MKNIGFAGLSLLFALLPASGGVADPRDDALSLVLRCLGMCDKAQHLVCYHSAVVRVPGALRAPSPPVAAPVAAPVASTTPASAARRRWRRIANGGTHAYPIPMYEDTIDEIAANVTSYDLSSGYLVVTLDNGQVWR